MLHLPDFGRNMILHDRRLAGMPPAGFAQMVYSIDGSVSLENMFSYISSYAVTRRDGKLSQLFIMCHGFAGEDAHRGVCDDVGGQGLLLAQETLTLNTVSRAAAIRGKVETITVYACAAADSSMARFDLMADGRRLMTELAANTGAHVVAADRIQWYSTGAVSDPASFVGNVGEAGHIDFGVWEGHVSQFAPDGSSMPLN